MELIARRVLSAYRLCLPARLRLSVLKECHDRSHFGVAKVHRDVQKRFYWSGMYSKVLQYCRSCEECLFQAIRFQGTLHFAKSC